MKRKKIWFQRFWLLGILTLGLCGMGGVYASWTNRLESRIHLSTDEFSMRVADGTTALVCVQGADGESLLEQEYPLSVEQEGKAVYIPVTDSVFAGVLAEGGALSATFPICCSEEDSFWAIGESQQETVVKVKPKQVLLISGEESFELPSSLAEPFEISISCRIQTQTEIREDGPYAVVTVMADEADKESLGNRPTTLTMTEEEWEQLVSQEPVNTEFQFDTEVSEQDIIGTDTGVAVIYQVPCVLYLDQAGGGET